MSDITLSKAVRANLLSLQNTADLMSKTQERLATGKKVNSALDNPSNFFTASALNARAGDLNALMDNMANGMKTIEAADNGLTAITKNLESMQSTLRQARQDKSFQVTSFDVTANSVLNISGGTLPDNTEIRLEEPYDGKKAILTSSAAYTGPALNGSQAGGARAAITWNASMAGTVDVVAIDGIGLDLSDPAITDAGTARTAMQAQLNASQPGVYSVAEAGGVISVEKLDTGAASPVVELGATAATPGSAKFTFDPVRMGTTIDVDGTPVTVAGNLSTFTSALQTQLGSGYLVSSDAGTQEITIRATTPGSTATPVVTGGALAATAASSNFQLSNTDAFSLEIDGLSFNFAAGTSDADVVAAFQADAGFSANWSINSDGAGAFTIVSTTTGAITAPDVTATALNSTEFTLNITGADTLVIAGENIAIGAADDQETILGTANAALAATDYRLVADGAGYSLVNIAGGPALAPADFSITGANVTFGTGPTASAAVDPTAEPVTGMLTENGLAEVTVNTVPGGDGATVENFAAPVDTINVTYGTTTMALNVRRGAEADMVQSMNDQFAIAGVGVTASFVNGNLVFESTAAEAKTLAVSGATGSAMFGPNTVSVGEAAVAPLNATQAVDKFVEFINQNHSTSIRASNDNGRLRIENLSTTEMTVVADKNGNGNTTPHTIGGNAVRSSLAREFNDLKNQLDRLSDDASFNGINLLRGDNLRITFNESGNSFIEIQTTTGDGLNAATLDLRDLDPSDLDADSSIDALLAEVKLSLNAVRTQASKFGSNLSIVQNRQDFTKRMINTLETGAANLTLADMNEEAANLLALQTRQSLSSSSLSLASQADQSVLQLLQ